jgi:hypothetical protein
LAFIFRSCYKNKRNFLFGIISLQLLLLNNVFHYYGFLRTTAYLQVLYTDTPDDRYSGYFTGR